MNNGEWETKYAPMIRWRKTIYNGRKTTLNTKVDGFINKALTF